MLKRVRHFQIDAHDPVSDANGRTNLACAFTQTMAAGTAPILADLIFPLVNEIINSNTKYVTFLLAPLLSRS